MKYKAGSLVTIRDDLKVGEDYNDIHVFDDMKDLFGRSGVVRDVILGENAVNVCGRWWSEDAVRTMSVFDIPYMLLRI